MQFRVLGPLEIVRAGEAVLIGSGRQRALLAALLAQSNAVVSSDRLIDILWGDSPPPSAAETLQAHVSRLRKLLSLGETLEGLILTRPPGYMLQVASAQVDALLFERLLKESREAAGTPAERADLLERGLTLWRGQAFAEFADQEFARAEAVRLEELRLSATEDLAEVRLLQGRHRELIGTLEALVAQHPLRARPRLQLALALYRSGRHAEALQACRHFRDYLVTELGLDPPPMLEEMEEDILRQADTLAWAPSSDDTGAVATQSAGVAMVSAPMPRNFPRSGTRFFGREAEVAGVIEALATARVLTLTGVGGVGKSRLALQVAGQLGADYPDGAWICELAPVVSPDAVSHAIASALGVQQPQGGTIEDALIGYLRGRRLLLVIDNCEHVVASAAMLIEAIVRACPGVSVLATSRERLAVEGERVWPVLPLSLPLSAEWTAARQSPAVELFVDRAQAVQPGFVLDRSNTGAVVEICRRLDGVPLALELAAARVRSMAPADIAARLDSRFRLLTSGRRADRGRHRTLQGVVDWSYVLLSPAEQRLFNRLSVFAGGFLLEQAEAICPGDGVDADEIAGHIAGLVDKSMVLADGAEERTRYALLETHRQNGRERLEEQGELDAWQRRHAAHFVSFAEQADEGVRGPQEARWVALVDREFDNLRAAHAWTVARGYSDLALRLPAALHFYAEYRMRSEAFAWAETAAAMPGAVGHSLLPAVLGSAAESASHRGEFHHAVELAEQALAATQGPDDPAGIRATDTLAHAALVQGRLDDCCKYGAETFRLAQALGDRYQMAEAYVAWALALAYQGRIDAALAMADDLGKLATALGNPTLTAWHLQVRGEVLGDRDPGRAMKLLAESIATSRSVLNRFTGTVALVCLTSLQGRHGEPREALASFRAAIEEWRRAGTWTHQWITLRNLLGLFVRLGVDGPAATLFGALTSDTPGAPAYGADAEQLRAAEHTLASRLGAERFADFVAQGRAMTGDDTVAFACAEIDRASAALTVS